MVREYKDLSIAKAERAPIAHLWGNTNWIAEEKCDGWRIQLHLGKPCSRLYAVTRGGEEIGQNIAHLAPQVDTSNLQYTVLDGELIPVDGEEFHSLAGVRAGKVERVAYKIFDVLYLNGIDVRGLPLEKRKELVSAVLNSIYLKHPYVVPVKQASKDTYKFLVELLAAGMEGVVLKDLRSTYGNGWLKAKKVSTFDTIITGIEPGYHMPHGKVHLAVCDGMTLRDVGKCGIQVEKVRIELNKNPNDFIGKVVEIKALKIDPSNGMLREPRFVRMRPDLSPLECTWEKLNRDALKIELE
jgi:bifunctional non-homologous end joining protein LigD